MRPSPARPDPGAAVRAAARLHASGLGASDEDLARVGAWYARTRADLDALAADLAGGDATERAERATPATAPAPTRTSPSEPRRPPPLTPGEPWSWSIAQLTDAFRRRSLSPVEVADALLGRIDRSNERLSAYLTVTPKRARSDARASERRYAAGRPLGPLDGVPIGIKDVFDTGGIRTTAGSWLYADRVPTRDAGAVRRLAAAGTVLLGKHMTWEFAMARTWPGGIHPPARNPWRLDSVPGGSSSGSAVAVAAGLCFGAIGSDTGGSVRIPPSFCGVAGFKPTFGLVSTAGLEPLSWTLDHVGPIARRVADLRALLEAITEAGPDGTDAGSRAAPLRIGAPLSFVETSPGVDPDTLAAYRAALDVLADLGCAVVPVEMPAPVRHTIVSKSVIQLVEVLAVHQERAAATPGLYGAAAYQRFQEAASLAAVDHALALRGRDLVSRAVDQLMETVDLLVLPTTVRPAWRFDEEGTLPPNSSNRFTQVFNLTGHPAVSVPCGLSRDGMPIGLQLVGRRFADEIVLRVAESYEAATDWTNRHPPDWAAPPA